MYVLVNYFTKQFAKCLWSRYGDNAVGSYPSVLLFSFIEGAQ
jgi:hypothetical protein